MVFIELYIVLRFLQRLFDVVFTHFLYKQQPGFGPPGTLINDWLIAKKMFEGKQGDLMFNPLSAGSRVYST